MGEQDALPSTQDAQTGSDVALATLPEVVISPQVSSGKVIDALRQFLPRQVMVEVVERIETESHPTSDKVVVAEEPAVAADAVAMVQPVAESWSTPPEPMSSVASPTPSTVVIAPPAPLARQKKRKQTDLPIAAPAVVSSAASDEIRDPIPVGVEREAVAVSPANSAAVEMPQLEQPLNNFGGELPRLLMNDLAHPLILAGGSTASPGWLSRLAVMLMPDAVGRLIQHPVLTILAGTAFGLLLLWWLLGQ